MSKEIAQIIITDYTVSLLKWTFGITLTLSILMGLWSDWIDNAIEQRDLEAKGESHGKPRGTTKSK